MKQLLFVLATLLAVALPATAQDMDNAGTEFFLPYLPNFSGGSNVEVHLTASVVTSVLVEFPANSPTFSQLVNVNPGAVTIVSLPTAAATGWSPGNVNNNLVHATAGDEFVAYMVNRRAFTSDAALGLPVDALNNEYYATTYYSDIVGSDRSLVAFGAAFDNTTVTVTPTADAVGGYLAGVPFPVVLNKGEGFLLRSTQSGATGDLTGTNLSSDRPIVVSNGNVCTNVPPSTTACDHIFETAHPVQTWGESALAAPLPNRPRGSVYRVVAAEANTALSRNGAPAGVLNAGEFAEFGPVTGPQRFAADGPIFVTQFMTGQTGSGSSTGDPASGNVIPTDQYLDSYVFSTVGGNQFADNFVTIIAANADVGSVLLDGSPVLVGEFLPIPGSGFSYATKPLTSGTHATQGPGPHGISVSGTNDFDSYIYPGGANFGFINMAGDENPPLCLVDLGSPTGATDARPSEDINGNNVLDPGEDLNNNGMIDEDTGIFQVVLAAGASNITLSVDPFVPGDPSVGYGVNLTDPSQPGTAIIVVTDGAGNVCETPVSIDPRADLAIEKTIEDLNGDPIPGNVLPVGEAFQFRIKVTNNGPADVTNIMVKDLIEIIHEGVGEEATLYDILHLPTATVEPGDTFDAWNTPLWTIDALASGEMATLLISGKLKAAHPFKNTALVMGFEPGFDPIEGNNRSMVLGTPKAVDVAVGKEIIAIDRDKESATYGHVTYRLTAENLTEIEATGNDPALGAGLRFIINDPLSSDFMFVSATEMMGAQDLGYGKYDETTGQWGLNVLEPGKTKFIDITVKLVDPANAPALIENTATLDPSTLNEFEKNSSNDTASATLFIADISVEKTVDDATPDEDQEITFTITVTNNGGSDVSSLSIEDILSDDSGLSGITPSWGAGTWDFGPLAAGTSAEATLTATVTGPVDFTNMASLAALPADVLDPIADNNMAMVDVVPNRVDIVVGKSVEILDELAGRVRFTLTATNFGPQDATGLELTDTADPEITPDLGTVSGDGTFDGTLWSLAALANGATATLTFEADVSSQDILTANPKNALDLTGVDQFEIELDDTPENPAEEDEHAEVAVPAADILVEKSVDNNIPELWETITFTVKVTNQGPSAVSNVMVKDPIKDALTGSLAAIVIDKSVGTFDLNSGTWTIPSLASGDMATLTVTGEVSDVATFKNTATLMGLQGAVDYNAANNMAMAAVEPVGADAIDLELVKTADLETAEVGDLITFFITVTNSSADGPVVDATGIIVADYLPAGLDYVWDTATSPADDARVVSVNQNALRWTISSLSADESIVLSFQAEVSGFGDLVNVAEIWDVDQTDLDRDSQTGAEGGAYDADTNPADAEDDQDDAQVWVPEPTNPQADLSLTKTVTDSSPKVGDKITFTVTVANAGAPSEGIQVRDILSDAAGCFEISLSTVTFSAGILSVHSSGGYLWLLDLGTNKSATLKLEGWVRCKTWFSNEAEIVSSGSLADASSGNDWAGVEVRPTGGSVTPPPPPPPSGDALCYLVADNDAEGQPSNDVLTALYNGSTQDVKVGHTGTQMIEAIAFNPWNRQLYAADARQLGVLNLGTGAFTALGAEFGSGWGLDEYGQLRSRGFLDVDGLAFDPYGGDKLYGTVRKTGEPDLLIRIDPATGKHVPNAFGQDRDYVTIQGVYGLTDIDDIAISPWDGTLYAINNRDGMQSRLVRLDRQTGVATKVLDLPLGNVEGLGFFGDGTLYGTAGEGNESLVVIHLSSGTTTVQAGIGAGGRDYESVDCLTNKTNRLAVTVFGDANGDGVMQADETPSAGLAVELQRDLDGDGIGDLVLAETTTAIDGAAAFETAATGSFVLVSQLAGATSAETAFEGFGATQTTVLGMVASSTAGEAEAELPEGFELGQNYPNPFNPVTTIGFAVPETASVHLAVYDVLGREVAVLVDGVQSAGQHEVRFDAAGLQTGTYLYRLSVDGRVAQTRQLVLMK